MGHKSETNEINVLVHHLIYLIRELTDFVEGKMMKSISNLVMVKCNSITSLDY